MNCNYPEYSVKYSRMRLIPHPKEHRYAIFVVFFHYLQKTVVLTDHKFGILSI